MKNHNRFYQTIAVLTLAIWIFSAQQAQAQREDYKVRETRAAPQVRQQLEVLRKRIQTRKLTFRVGYTYALERGLENVTGGMKPKITVDAARKQNSLAEKLIAIDADTRRALNIPPPKLQIACSANLAEWDWRKEGKVPPIRQQKCGNCWAYAALAVYEISYSIRNNLSIDGSEQYVVSNNDNGAGKCEFPGGTSAGASEFLVTRGTTSEAVMPDMGITGTPDPSIATPYNGVAWGYADADNPVSPGVQKIKQAICDHGAVASWIDAGGSFGGYVGGDDAGSDVYNDDDDKEPGHKVGGHYIAIIGWDDARGAWLIRNSWGENWGFNAGYGTERGYGWIKYGTHSVGSYVSWVQAQGVNYALPQKYYDLMPMKNRFIKVNPGVIKQTTVKKP